MDDDIQQRVDCVQTERDAFELFREYPHSFPTYDPENLSYFDNLCDAPTFGHVDGDFEHERPWWAGFGSSLEAVHRDYFAPFLNATTFRLMNWFYNASLQKSIEDLRRLVDNVMLAEDFDREDLRDFNPAREAKRLDNAENDPSSTIFSSDGWHEASVNIRLPCEKERFDSEDDAPMFEVEGLYYRKPLEVLKAAFMEEGAKSFHTSPYKISGNLTRINHRNISLRNFIHLTQCSKNIRGYVRRLVSLGVILKRSLRRSCYGPTPRTSPVSVMRRYGQSICLLVTSQNTFDRSRHPSQLTILHIFQRYVDCTENFACQC
ncbi:hypothetical protein DEU56DRAFT_737272 [Suillus clintonianus]|uniref:uncharacterized protein n=1 Tax=Suillus clintonianus TaxID=1904413 RepID=UPI001B876D98|nr:uncharacterized protein DEU56DRAFT_737272 [Suillus clintonianus]KAG2136440.1 hypothetical protein DEU56DRAFT_737272 [Suillus clintonianus]